jgi:malate dehydrogenase
MHSTPNATANATLQVIAAALIDDKRQVHGQVKMAGEALEIDGVCGFSIMIDRDGWPL